ncbi:Schwann cell myelin protein-like [Notolabrus celidotus]|uniref:Schwann cell myelin protein-like n=1 Tax=Notolabrus celidotus TaxID=1203425 RepID=UPI00148F446B|nr:Schwann cell myelin protein-like [Notolabrus celidotus]
MGTTCLLRLLIMSTGFSVLQQVRSWGITVPKTVTAVEGSCVVVPCKTKTHVWATWYQYAKFSYPKVYDRFLPSVEQQYRGRTSVLGSAAEGNCTLLIRNIKREDNNLEVYVWIDPDSPATQKYYDQTVRIYVERQSPIITIQEQIVEGDIFQANCSIIHSCPLSPPSLKWTRSQFMENSTLMEINKQVQLLWMYTETLHGLATYKLHNSTMRCSALFSDLTLESQQVTLNILYKPVTVMLTLKKESVIDGDNVIMECAANSNPSPHTYKWFSRQMGQNTIINTTDGKLLFENITQKTSFSCVAYNDIGEGQSDWVDLDVQFAPTILPESSCHLRGEFLKCVCQAEAFPDASIQWAIDGNDSLSSSVSLVSKNYKHIVSGELSGQAQSQANVTCTATNSLGKHTKQLYLNKMPTQSSFSIWLGALLLVGIALLFGSAAVIYRNRHRSPPGSVCNTAILLRPLSVSENMQGELRYNNPQSLSTQVEDTQSNSCRAGSDSEGDEPSCIYDNDVVEELRRSRAQQNNTTAP